MASFLKNRKNAANKLAYFEQNSQNQAKAPLAVPVL